MHSKTYLSTFICSLFLAPVAVLGAPGGGDGDSDGSGGGQSGGGDESTELICASVKEIGHYIQGEVQTQLEDFYHDDFAYWHSYGPWQGTEFNPTIYQASMYHVDYNSVEIGKTYAAGIFEVIAGGKELRASASAMGRNPESPAAYYGKGQADSQTYAFIVVEKKTTIKLEMSMDQQTDSQETAFKWYRSLNRVEQQDQGEFGVNWVPVEAILYDGKSRSHFGQGETYYNSFGDPVNRSTEIELAPGTYLLEVSAEINASTELTGVFGQIETAITSRCRFWLECAECDSPEDLNSDGNVDGEDMTMMLGVWGTDNQAADLNSDGIVDGADFSQLLGAWN